MAQEIAIIDGFDDYPSKTGAGIGFTSSWTLASDNGNVLLLAGRVGGRCLQLSNTATAYKVIPNATKIAVFFGYRQVENKSATLKSICEIRNNADIHVAVQIVEPNDLLVSGPGGILATVPLAFITNTWHSISILVEIHDTLGTVGIWIDGDPVLNLTNSDTKNAAAADANRVYLLAVGTASSPQRNQFDDFRVDIDAATHILEGRSAQVFMVADDSIQWAPSAGAVNYAMIDEAQADGDVTYNSANTVGFKDKFVSGGLGFNPDRIDAVMISMAARKGDVATRRIASLIDSGGVETQSPDHFLATDYTWDRKIHPLNPNGNAAWNKASVEGIKPGYVMIE